jgi:NADPH:quinone reductase-like Zn-dependent oxidoreductase
MQAIQRVVYSDDPSTAFDVRSVPKPTLPSDDHVVVAVHAWSINPVDVKLSAGWFSGFVSEPMPRTIGFDVAGVVEQVGTRVKDLQVGDKVFGDTGVDTQNAAAEFVACHAGKLAKIPDGVSFDDAASIPLVALSALDALQWARVTDGQTVVVRGASSGVGTAAVQIARCLGAKRVIGISSREELCKQLGCDEVVNYRTAKWEEVLKGRNADVFFDCIGGPDVFEGSKGVLKPSGAFATVAGDEQAAISIPRILKVVGAVLSRTVMSWVSSAPSYGFIMKKETPEKMAQLARWMGDGKLRAVLDPLSPLPFGKSSVVTMAKKMHEGSAVGKLVMRVPQTPK